MTASQDPNPPATELTGQFDLLTTIDEFLRSGDDVYDLLAAFCSTSPADNGRLTACTLIDLFSFHVAALRRQPQPSPDQH